MQEEKTTGQEPNDPSAPTRQQNTENQAQLKSALGAAPCSAFMGVAILAQVEIGWNAPTMAIASCGFLAGLIYMGLICFRWAKKRFQKD